MEQNIGSTRNNKNGKSGFIDISQIKRHDVFLKWVDAKQMYNDGHIAEAYEFLMKEMTPYIKSRYWLIIRSTGNEQDANDFEQNCWERLIKHFKNFHPFYYEFDDGNYELSDYDIDISNEPHIVEKRGGIGFNWAKSLIHHQECAYYHSLKTQSIIDYRGLEDITDGVMNRDIDTLDIEAIIFRKDLLKLFYDDTEQIMRDTLKCGTSRNVNYTSRNRHKTKFIKENGLTYYDVTK